MVHDACSAVWGERAHRRFKMPRPVASAHAGAVRLRHFAFMRALFRLPFTDWRTRLARAGSCRQGDDTRRAA